MLGIITRAYHKFMTFSKETKLMDNHFSITEFSAHTIPIKSTNFVKTKSYDDT